MNAFLLLLFAVIYIPFRPVAAGGGGGGFDADFANVVLLGHFAGMNDSSDSAHVMTAVADAQIDTAQSMFSGTSLLLDGTGDEVSLADSADWFFDDGDFTIEGWARPASATAAQTVIAQWGPGGTNFFVGVGAGYGVYLNGTLRIPWSAWPSADVWHHWAVCRSGADLRLFVDGVQVGSTYNIATEALPDSSDSLKIGGDGLGNPHFAGHMDDVRITKVVSRHTPGFLVPSYPFWSPPEFVAASALSTTSSVDIPAATVDGDTVLFLVTGAGSPALTVPGGCTLVDGHTWTTLGYETTCISTVWHTGDPTSQSFGSASVWSSFAVTYRQADSLAAGGVLEQRSGATMTFTGNTPGTYYVQVGMVVDRDPNPFTAPATMATRRNDSGSFFQHGVFDLRNADGSNRDVGQASTSTDGVGIFFNLKPRP